MLDLPRHLKKIRCMVSMLLFNVGSVVGFALTGVGLIEIKSKAPSSYLMVCGNNCMKCCPFGLVDPSTIWNINVYLMSASEDFSLLIPNRYQR